MTKNIFEEEFENELKFISLYKSELAMEIGVLMRTPSGAL